MVSSLHVPDHPPLHHSASYPTIDVHAANGFDATTKSDGYSSGRLSPSHAYGRLPPLHHPSAPPSAGATPPTQRTAPLAADVQSQQTRLPRPATSSSTITVQLPPKKPLPAISSERRSSRKLGSGKLSKKKTPRGKLVCKCVVACLFITIPIVAFITLFILSQGFKPEQLQSGMVFAPAASVTSMPGVATTAFSPQLTTQFSLSG